MHTTVYFVRHAHSNYTPDELGRPLSAKGSEDAVKITQLLKNKKIDYIISSPYKRAVQTVEGVARSKGKQIEFVDGFRERRLSDGPVEDFELAMNRVWSNFNFS